MASGDTLIILTPHNYDARTQITAAHFGLGIRNNHPLISADDSNKEFVFTCVMPQAYAGGGVTIRLWACNTGTSGSVGFRYQFERMHETQDIDTDGHPATWSTTTLKTVSATSGQPDIWSSDISDGANMDSVTAGDTFRLIVGRDAGTDTNTAIAQILAIEIQEQ